jgi:hypothetical protein
MRMIIDIDIDIDRKNDRDEYSLLEHDNYVMHGDGDEYSLI